MLRHAIAPRCPHGAVRAVLCAVAYEQRAGVCARRRACRADARELGAVPCCDSPECALPRAVAPRNVRTSVLPVL